MINYQDLIVWQKSMDLAEEVYKLIKFLPKDEMYVISSQLKRASISIPSNIAEGNSRNTTKEYIQFLYIARGSKAEIETQLLLCDKLHLLQKNQVVPVLDLCSEIGKMLNSLIVKLESKINP